MPSKPATPLPATGAPVTVSGGQTWAQEPEQVLAMPESLLLM
jgi:hypothetical protein